MEERKEKKVEKQKSEITLRTKKVRLVAINPKYRDRPLFVSPKYDDKKRRFITGQNITEQQMRGIEPLGVKSGNIKEIINPDEQYPLIHNVSLIIGDGGNILSIDQDLYNFYLTLDIVAKRKSEIRKGVHLFYIEDIEENATEEINKIDLIYNVIKKLKEDVSTENYKNIAIYLGVNVKTMSAKQIESKVYDFCQKEPQAVQNFFTPTAKRVLSVLKLHMYELIKKQYDSYYFNEVFLGRTPEEVANFLESKENASIASVLINELDKKERKDN